MLTRTRTHTVLYNRLPKRRLATRLLNICGRNRDHSVSSTEERRPPVASTRPIVLSANDVSWQAFVEYYHGKRPVVLKAASDLSRWSFESWLTSLRLKEDLAEEDLVIRGRLNTLSQRGNAELVRMSVAEVVQEIFRPAEDAPAGPFWQWRTGLGSLGSGQHNGDPLPAAARLPRCVPLPRLLREWPGVVVRPDGESAVFVTSPWGRTALHQDDYDNTLLHLHGAKSIVMIDPSWLQSHPRLLGSLFTTPGSHASIYDASGVGLHDIRGIPRCEIDLEPGDVIYIPRGWLHDVESRSATVSVALRFEVGTQVSPDAIFNTAMS